MTGRGITLTIGETEIEAVRNLIYGALVSFAGAEAALAFLLLKPKLGL